LLRFTILTLLISIPIICNGQELNDEQRKKQAELDFACEVARQAALAPQKMVVYKECINEFKKSEEYCLKEGDGYNGTRIHGSPLFYDLPECEVAFKNMSTYRRSE